MKKLGTLLLGILLIIFVYMYYVEGIDLLDLGGILSKIFK